MTRQNCPYLLIHFTEIMKKRKICRRTMSGFIEKNLFVSQECSNAIKFFCFILLNAEIMKHLIQERFRQNLGATWKTTWRYHHALIFIRKNSRSINLLDSVQQTPVNEDVHFENHFLFPHCLGFLLRTRQNLNFQGQHFHFAAPKDHFNDRNRYSYFCCDEKNAFFSHVVSHVT